MAVVQHNMSAMNTNRQLGISTKEKAKASEKLSSGYKINRAADDSAGLSISEKMRWQIRGLAKGSTNTEDGISMLNTADGGMEEISTMLRRLKELSVQAANDTNTLSDREAIQSEVDEIKLEIDRISSSTHFNGISLLDNTFGQKIDSTTGTVLTGLAYILGGDKVTTSGILGEEIQINGVLTGTTSTGKDYLYDKKVTTEKNGNSFTTTSDIYDPLSVCLGRYTAGTISLTNGGTQDTNISGNTVTIDTKDSSGNIIEKQKIEFVDKTGNLAGASIDFSGLGSDYQIEDLINQGFNSQCATCSQHYSLKFIEGTQNKYNNSSGHPVFEVGVDGVTTGSQLVDKIMSAIQNASQPGFISHYTQYAKDDAKLLVYDYRQYVLKTGTYKQSIFEPTVFKPDGETPERREFHIQFSSRQGDALELYLPNVTTSRMGINGLYVCSFEDASESIKLVDDAINYLNTERSKVGAYVNRLEHARAIVDNTHENVSMAESKIRDTDMAAMMVVLSKYSILQQAGQSMLAQANQTPQGVLELLQ